MSAHNGEDNVIDLLLMDVDGAEYELLEVIACEQFLKFTTLSLYESNNSDQRQKLPVICQINIEMHITSALNTTTNEIVPGYNGYRTTFPHAFRIMEKLFEQYALLQSSYYAKASFLRVFLINHADEECVKKFLC